MRKINKDSKCGFTLVEMILVIALIVILAGVLTGGLVSYLKGANSTSQGAVKHDAAVDKAMSEARGKLK